MMSQCWMRTPENRPDFSQLLRQIEGLVKKEQDTYARISMDPSEMGMWGGYMVPKNTPTEQNTEPNAKPNTEPKTIAD